MRPTSYQTRNSALWATPCASVSANRTRTSVENLNSSRGTEDGTLRADQRQPAVRRAHGSRGLDRERDPGLPLADRDLGAVRPDGIRVDRRVPGRSGEGV